MTDETPAPIWKTYLEARDVINAIVDPANAVDRSDFATAVSLHYSSDRMKQVGSLDTAELLEEFNSNIDIFPKAPDGSVYFLSNNIAVAMLRGMDPHVSWISQKEVSLPNEQKFPKLVAALETFAKETCKGVLDQIELTISKPGVRPEQDKPAFQETRPYYLCRDIYSLVLDATDASKGNVYWINTVDPFVPVNTTAGNKIKVRFAVLNYKGAAMLEKLKDATDLPADFDYQSIINLGNQ